MKGSRKNLWLIDKTFYSLNIEELKKILQLIMEFEQFSDSRISEEIWIILKLRS